ncbi:MAG: AsmA-like C-terminal region-containing protein [Bacteroidota bacterium]
MRTLRKVLLYLLVSLLVLFSGAIISVYLFKDRIIKQFVAEANKHLNTPVTIGQINVSVWTDFPNLAIEFNDVYVEGSLPGKDTLLWAQRISFSLNPIEVWNKNYEIKGLHLQNSRTHLYVNAVGKTNYAISKSATGENGSISFNLKNVSLQKTFVSYRDRSAHQHHIFASDELQASIGIAGALYKIEAGGDVTTRQIGIGKRIFLANKTFQTEAQIDYDDDKKQVVISPSQLLLGAAAFLVEGTYGFDTKNIINLTAKGKDTNIQTLFSLMPQEIAQQFEAYKSDGDVYFDLTLKGEISDEKNPWLTVAFGATNATIHHPSYQSRIDQANLEGSFATPSLASLADAELFLRNIKGMLNNKPFEANFSLQNFENPLVALEFKGDVDAASLLKFYPFPDVKELTGEIKADFYLSGRTELLKKKTTAQQVKTGGTLELLNLHAVLGKKEIDVSRLSGTLQFTNNDLALSNVSGQLENTDFLLNGHFKNIITFLLFENQPIGIEAELRSGFVDLDQLFELGYGDRQSEDYEFSLSPNVHLNFNCDVQSLHYKKFKPRQLKGNLLIKNQMAVSRDISVKALGGELTLNGILDAKNPKAIDVVSSFKLNGIHVDSLFYLFDDFGQSFIQSKHLKGQAVADVSLEMTLNEKLNLFPETLIADVSTTIKNGELNNFEPLQALNKYLDDEGLSKLRFADLKNDIHIENKTVYIPQMEIRSNVTTIQLSGTHTFDQHIDYRLVAPLRNKKKIDPDEAFGAIEQDSKGQTKIFLKITGTTDAYHVSLDKAAVKQKIASDLKKEVQELKEAFKLKGKKKKKELELSDEEFDWEY